MRFMIHIPPRPRRPPALLCSVRQHGTLSQFVFVMLLCLLVSVVHSGSGDGISNTQRAGTSVSGTTGMIVGAGDSLAGVQSTTIATTTTTSGSDGAGSTGSSTTSVIVAASATGLDVSTTISTIGTTKSAVQKDGVIASLSRSTCPSRTANYITHTLVQQCLKANRTAGVGSSVVAIGQGEGEHSGGAARTQVLTETVDGEHSGARSASEAVVETSTSTSILVASISPTPSAETDTDSPLDNANFLSFEEWKKQNLARLEKAKESSGRDDGGAGKPGIQNALDSMSDGETFDMSLELGGSDIKTPTTKSGTAHSTNVASGNEQAKPSERPRKKDAGTTCKERFNYASTDCAAGILKTNPKCKSASAVLKENKDSYMLNECSIQNKFLIVELCDDILVDTVVLANFEFFSSMFRTFRVSVSDRYPVELDRWKVLGTFEARNAREIQPFAIHNPLIWARYLRIEFLNHYGAEYYCPVSLLRVHGTTMIDELRDEPTKAHEGDEAGAVAEPEPSPIAVQVSDVVIESDKPISTGKYIKTQEGAETSDPATSKSTGPPSPAESSNKTSTATENTPTTQSISDSSTLPFVGPLVSSSLAAQLEKEKSAQQKEPVVSPSTTSIEHSSSSQSADMQKSSSTQVSSSQNSSSTGSVAAGSGAAPSTSTAKSQSSTAKAQNVNAQSQAQGPASKAPSKAASNVVQPPAPSPTTQESFFKTFHKRLQVLETNAALSLQYMEEQSRILRDAFTKVEKRQKTKVDDFVFHLNTTVMTELRGFRQQYDQLWQSTVIELESHRDQYQREILTVSTRLSMLAEELVWQKRMALVQTTLLVICLTLFIFVRSSNGGSGHLEVPIMQSWLNKSHSMLGFPFDSPRPGSKSSATANGGTAGAGAGVGAGGRRLMRVRSVDDLDEDSDDQHHQLLNSPSPTPSATTTRLGTEHDEYEYANTTTPTKSNGASQHDDLVADNSSVDDTPSPPVLLAMPTLASRTTASSSTSTSTTTTTARLKALIGKSRSGPTTPRGTREGAKDSLGILWAEEQQQRRVREASPLSREFAAASIEDVDVDNDEEQLLDDDDDDDEDDDHEEDREEDAYEDASDHGSFHATSPTISTSS